MPAKISLIAAISENRGLGKDNRLLFHLREDLKRFRQITLYHPVIMGRKTFESLGKKPLPSRLNIIVTHQKDYLVPPGCYLFHSLEKAIAFARRKEKKEIFVIGGGQIYEQAIKIADKLYLTVVKGNFPADTFFPDYSAFRRVVFQKEGQEGKLRYVFFELEKG